MIDIYNARQSTTKVGHAYHDLVDYLMFRYLLGYKELAPPTLPQTAAPVIPDVARGPAEE